MECKKNRSYLAFWGKDMGHVFFEKKTKRFAMKEYTTIVSVIQNRPEIHLHKHCYRYKYNRTIYILDRGLSRLQKIIWSHISL